MLCLRFLRRVPAVPASQPPPASLRQALQGVSRRLQPVPHPLPLPPPSPLPVVGRSPLPCVFYAPDVQLGGATASSSAEGGTQGGGCLRPGVAPSGGGARRKVRKSLSSPELSSSEGSSPADLRSSSSSDGAVGGADGAVGGGDGGVPVASECRSGYDSPSLSVEVPVDVLPTEPSASPSVYVLGRSGPGSSGSPRAGDGDVAEGLDSLVPPPFHPSPSAEVGRPLPCRSPPVGPGL